jgi:hypothetical protein
VLVANAVSAVAAPQRFHRAPELRGTFQTVHHDGQDVGELSRLILARAVEHGPQRGIELEQPFVERQRRLVEYRFDQGEAVLHQGDLHRSHCVLC